MAAHVLFRHRKSFVGAFARARSLRIVRAERRGRAGVRDVVVVVGGMKGMPDWWWCVGLFG